MIERLKPVARKSERDQCVRRRGVFGGVLKSERTLEYVCKETQLGRRDVMSMRDLTDQANENSITISARDEDPELAKRVVSLHIDALNDINSDLSSPLFADDSKVLEQRIQEQQTEIKITENKLLAFQNQALTAPSVAEIVVGPVPTVSRALSHRSSPLRHSSMPRSPRPSGPACWNPHTFPSP